MPTEQRLRVMRELVRITGEDPEVMTMLKYGTIKSAISAYTMLGFMSERDAEAYDDFERVLATIEEGEPDFSRLEGYPRPIAALLASHLAAPAVGILELTEEDVQTLHEEVLDYVKTFPELPNEIVEFVPRLEPLAKKEAKEPKREAKRNVFRLL